MRTISAAGIDGALPVLAVTPADHGNLTKAQIELGDKVVKATVRQHPTATVTLRGPKKARFTVTIKATTRTHTTMSATVHYKACAAKKKAPPRKPHH